MSIARTNRINALAAVCWIAAAAPGTGQAPSPGHLSNDGVLRASSQVDSVFVARTKADGRVDGGDWASYLLARLGAGPAFQHHAAVVNGRDHVGRWGALRLAPRPDIPGAQPEIELLVLRIVTAGV